MKIKPGARQESLTELPYTEAAIAGICIHQNIVQTMYSDLLPVLDAQQPNEQGGSFWSRTRTDGGPSQRGVSRGDSRVKEWQVRMVMEICDLGMFVLHIVRMYQGMCIKSRIGLPRHTHNGALTFGCVACHHIKHNVAAQWPDILLTLLFSITFYSLPPHHGRCLCGAGSVRDWVSPAAGQKYGALYSALPNKAGTKGCGSRTLCALLTSLDVANGMKLLHKYKILHSDLKPHNVLLCSSHTV